MGVNRIMELAASRVAATPPSCIVDQIHRDADKLLPKDFLEALTTARYQYASPDRSEAARHALTLSRVVIDCSDCAFHDKLTDGFCPGSKKTKRTMRAAFTSLQQR